MEAIPNGESSSPPVKIAGGCRSMKTIIKFCLIYLSNLLLLTLIFTAFRNEHMTDEQKFWWWAFLGSLVASSAMTMTALLILVYTDFNHQNSVPAEVDNLESSKGINNNRAPIINEQSGSFKTVLTINSAPPDQSLPASKQQNQQLEQQLSLNSQPMMMDLSATVKQQQQQRRQASPPPTSPPTAAPAADKFINLTPSPPPKSPVTVIDMPSMNAKKRAADSTNLLPLKTRNSTINEIDQVPPKSQKNNNNNTEKTMKKKKNKGKNVKNKMRKK